jgi:hypothetical protein
MLPERLGEGRVGKVRRAEDARELAEGRDVDVRPLASPRLDDAIDVIHERR